MGICEKPCAVMRRTRTNHIPLKRFGDSSRSRKMLKTVPFYGQEGYVAKNFLPVKVKIFGAFALQVGSYAG